MSNGAAEALYSFISVEDSIANEFAGPKSVIDYLEKVTGKEVAEEESDLIYENRKLIPAAPIGEIRTAISSDYELIFKWMTAFIEETALRSFDLENMVRSALDKGRYALLEVECAVVSLGGNSDIQVFDGNSHSNAFECVISILNFMRTFSMFFFKSFYRHSFGGTTLKSPQQIGN